jgi:2-polyprenyl-3-methyl-5-hydroxy-6-metoxy-1,4-benzoquinol methylase
MERLCEPELMEDPQQALAYAEADFAATDQELVEAIKALLPPATGRQERLLDLGCGPGNISFRLARPRPGASLLAIDGAPAMLQLAEQRRQADPLAWPGLRFHQACLPLPPGWAEGLPTPFQPPFSALVSNSLLHHLHDPLVLWRSLHQLGGPGALVVVRDLRRPASLAATEALVQRYAATAPAVLRRDLAHSLRAAFRPAEVRRQLAATGLETLTVEALGDRYLQVTGRLPTGRLGP